jgi:hypothetical protein
VETITNPPITISQFASDINLLNTPLWRKQEEILEDFWTQDYSIAIWALGRRSGKTLMAAVTATYAACMLADSYKTFLRNGEKFYIVSIANTIDQSRIALQGVKDLINSSPILKALIVKETSDTLELSNGAVFRAMPASSRGGRGLPVPLLIFDELAHAIDTQSGNASGLFAVEYGANFSKSLSAFVDSDLIESAINYERSVLPPQAKYKGRYCLSLDPAKGNRDDYTACIVHYEGERLIVDKWHEFKPSLGEGKKKQVSVAEVESWILEQHQLYGFSETVLDQYNSSGIIQRLSGRLNISEMSWTAPSKTEAYSKLRELFNAGNLELYPHGKANQQLKNLTVIFRSSGQWSVTGGNGSAVDDFPSALAGCILKAHPSKQIYSVASLPDTDRYGRAVTQTMSSGRSSARQIREFF